MNIQTVPNPSLGNIIDSMIKFAVAGGRSPDIILHAQNICKNVTSGDYASEVLAVNYWVCQNIRYIPDPTNVELVKDPKRLMETGSGDCDDIAVLCAALLLAIGKTPAFMLVAFNGSPMPSHVFALAKTPSGWVPLDPVANRVTAKMMKDATKKWVVPLVGHGLTDGAF